MCECNCSCNKVYGPVKSWSELEWDKRKQEELKQWAESVIAEIRANPSEINLIRKIKNNVHSIRI